MTEHRRRIRYKVEFPAIFAGHHAGTGIVYDLGLGGCKLVSHRVVTCGSLISVHLNIPKHTTPISIRAATVQWVLQHGFGIEFLEMHPEEQARLEQFLATQLHIAP